MQIRQQQKKQFFLTFMISCVLDHKTTQICSLKSLSYFGCHVPVVLACKCDSRGLREVDQSILHMGKGPKLLFSKLFLHSHAFFMFSNSSHDLQSAEFLSCYSAGLFVMDFFTLQINSVEYICLFNFFSIQWNIVTSWTLKTPNSAIFSSRVSNGTSEWLEGQTLLRDIFCFVYEARFPKI